MDRESTEISIPDMAPAPDIESKQNFLRRAILDAGYNPDQFGEFMVGEKENGDNLENWELDELKDAVNKFINQFGSKTPPNELNAIVSMPPDDLDDDMMHRDSTMQSARMSFSKPTDHPFERMLEVISDSVVNCKSMYIHVLYKAGN